MLLVWLTGCSSYTHIGLGEIADHGKVRVTTTDGDRTTIHNPRVEADSIKGPDAGAIHMEEVTKLEAVGTDEVGTVLNVIGLAILTAAAAVGVFLLVCRDGMMCPR